MIKKIALPLLLLTLLGFKHPDNSLNDCDISKTLGNAAPVIDGPGQNDGPYVLYKNDNIYAKYIVQSNGIRVVQTDSMAVSGKKNLSLRVNTDDSTKTFLVQLKDKLQNEKAEFKKVSRQFVISDIEGNFGAIRKLLQGNGVIDANYNWTFGNGHLVLIGDFVDRGAQVTEVLWLIYSLEEKAKAAGGYVHFILGNHEIMNMSNDLRYLHPKYVEGAILLNEHFMELFGENSELGRWLRTKNIMEKIGDVLYTHAGISSQMNLLNTSISDINKLARPFYADTTYNYPNVKLEIIYSDFGPFWYRGYYQGKEKASTGQIDSTLSWFGAEKIVTGHTIVAETISAWYNGKVINTDVHHAQGKSEALLIEGNKCYRVNMEGKKELLL